MSLLTQLRDLIPRLIPAPGRTEVGRRPTEEARIRYLYQQMQPDWGLRATILELRKMDRLDGRVKKIHTRMARTATKGGLRLEWSSRENSRIRRLWEAFERRLHLDRQAKIESDCRCLVMEGNLPMQWVVSDDGQIVAAVRMPTETIMPLIDDSGRFKTATAAYAQYDMTEGRQIATFPLWQLTVERLEPDNIDDLGAMGRPYLDASRTVWRQLRMTEEDLVIRRRERAPLRFSHILEGAKKDELEAYRAEVISNQQRGAVYSDFFSNRKGGVTALQGDANLDQIADVAHLLDSFYAGGSPAPKGLFGYADGLSRDILEDLKQDYFEEIDALQDTVSWVYEQGFRLELLLAGINPDATPFYIDFVERRTETPNQSADRALKYQALGVPATLCWDTAGLDPATVQAAIDAQAVATDPYPNDPAPPPAGGTPTVKITPGNAPKGESATSINNAGGPQ